MRPITALIVVLLSAGLAFSIGWFSKDGPAPEGAGTTKPAPAADPKTDETPALGDGVETKLADARRKLSEEQDRRRRLEQERDHLVRELAARKASAEGNGVGPEEAAGSHEPRFRYQKFEEALTSIDWTKSAEATVNLASLLSKWGEEIEKGNRTPNWIGQLQRWNGPLVSAAISAQNAEVPGTGVNGAFSHPSIMANLVQATLIEAGEPLDEDQEKQLRELGRKYVEEDARRLDGYPEGTLALEKTIDEAALKDRFYADVDRLVTSVQREILHPEAIRGRLTLDLFSSGIIWLTMAEATRYTDREDLVRQITRAAMQHFTLADEHKDAVHEAARRWGGSFTQEYLDEEADALSQAGRVTVARVNVAARSQLVFYKTLLERLPADSELAKRVRNSTRIVLPLKRRNS